MNVSQAVTYRVESTASRRRGLSGGQHGEENIRPGMTRIMKRKDAAHTHRMSANGGIVRMLDVSRS